jgi:hypothetical protein
VEDRAFVEDLGRYRGQRRAGERDQIQQLGRAEAWSLKQRRAGQRAPDGFGGLLPSTMVAWPELSGRVGGYRAFRGWTALASRRREFPA